MNSPKIHFINLLLAVFVIFGGLFVSINQTNAVDSVPGVQVRDGDGLEPCSARLDDGSLANGDGCDNGGSSNPLGDPFVDPRPPQPPMMSSNASSSVTVIVEPENDTDMTGEITAENNDCIIPLGSSNCSVLFNWSTENPVATSSVTRNPATDFTVQNANSGTDVSLPVAHGSSWFFLYNNEIKLDEVEVEAICDPDTSEWSDYYGQCVAFTEITNGLLNISPSACTVANGASTCTVTGATWTTENATNPYLEDANTGAILSTLANNSTPLTVWVSYPKTVFELNDQNGNLDSKEVTASCTSGTVWDTTQGKCVEEGQQDLCPDIEGIQTTLPCIEEIHICPAPLSRTVEVVCDLKNGVEAVSGSVLRSQDKEAYPSCVFETPVTTENSIYVSDTCVYPVTTCSNGATNYPDCNNNLCPVPLSRIVEVACDSRDGVEATSGSVLRSQEKSAYPICAFATPVTGENSAYVSDTCSYEEEEGGGSGDALWGNSVCGECNPVTQRRNCTRVCDHSPSTGKYCSGDTDMDGIWSYSESCGGVIGGGLGTPLLNIILTVSPEKIFKGKTATISWTSEADSCEAVAGEGFETLGLSDGEDAISPIKTTTYEIECRKGEVIQRTNATLKVTNISIIES